MTAARSCTVSDQARNFWRWPSAAHCCSSSTACPQWRRRWIPIAKVSLAIAMAIRFIPLISGLVHEVREAQRVRGLERSILAVAMPVIVRTLKMGNEIAEALDARSFGTAEPAARKERR